MKPWETLDTARAPDGTPLVLARRGEEFVVRAGGHVLMSSRQHSSEERMAHVVTARVPTNGHVLVGGLGLGFTLRAVLDGLGQKATVTVAELLPELVAWNRGPLGPLAAHPLDDPRVRTRTGDVFEVLASLPRSLDAVLLDVDNGPSALTTAKNARLYAKGGLDRVRAALRPSGVVVVWSAGPDAGFEKRLREAGFSVETESARAAEGGRSSRHTLFVGTTSA